MSRCATGEQFSQLAQRVQRQRVFATRDVFVDYRVFEIKATKGVPLTHDLLAYLDCLRLRGLNGARRWLADHAENKREAKAQIRAHEQLLQRLAAEWWQPQDFGQSVIEILRQSPAWPFLRVMDLAK